MIMKKLPLILFIFGVTIGSIACKSRKAKIQDTYYLEVSKTPCFGKCPIYTLSVFSDGNALLNAKRFMTLEGLYKVKINADSLALLSACVKAVNWKELEEEYLTGYSDLPSSELKYSSQAGDTIFVRWESEKAPETLLKLGEKLESIQQNNSWHSLDLN